MQRGLLIGLLVIPAVLLSAKWGVAQSSSPTTPPCEDGYMVVEEIVYRSVVRTYCRMVPEVKKVKKTVYSMKEVPFCLTKSPSPFHCRHAEGDNCPNCEECARCRRVLVKHEVTEEVPSFKCVTESVVEEVPCTVYRRVPCSPSVSPAEPLVPRPAFPAAPLRKKLSD